MVMAPRIIPRKEHRISRKQISQNALRTLYRLHSKGYIAHLVGGCVRDLLLGRTPKDFDISTNATPNQIKRLFRNCRLVGRRFRLAHLHFSDEILEVSTFRRDAEPSDAVEPEAVGPHQRPPHHMKDEDGMVLRDNLFGTPEEDALRRDFTINAFAYNIADLSVIDYSTGLSDLRQNLIRPIGDPAVRFTEDPVRMLRAVRFAASHGFTIESSAWECTRTLASAITRARPARLAEEVQKLFLSGCAMPALSLLSASGLLEALFPELNLWISSDSARLGLLEANLASLDEAHRKGTRPSMALFVAALFGPSLEEAALAEHLEGIPYHQSLDGACTTAMKTISETVTIPARVGSQLRAILSLQQAMHKRPPRRPAATAAKPEFADALAYLRLIARTRIEFQPVLEWWEAFIAGTPAPSVPELSAEAAPQKKKRRRRRRHPRPASVTDDSPERSP